MAVHSITVKQLVSRIRQVFPDTPENYVLNLINDALVEVGLYQTKVVQAKMDITADLMYYDLADSSSDSGSNKLEVNKVLRVFLLDNDGDYINIPRLIDKELLLADAGGESALNVPN